MPLTFKDKMNEVFFGPETARFFILLPFLKLIDNRLDKMSPEEWLKYGEATLGDKPSEFLRHLLDEKDFATVADQVERFRSDGQPAEEFAKDVWQVYNLLGLQLREIAKVSAAMRDDPDNLDLRRKLVEQHEHLSVLATAAGDFTGIGKDVRALAETHGNNLQEIYPKLVTGRDVKVGSKSKPTNMERFGAANQVIDDANDFVGDLISEVDHKRINPNRFILKLIEQGIAPRDFLRYLRHEHPKAFEPGGRLRGKDIGKFREVILAELRDYAESIKLISKDCAMIGVSINADSFPTSNDDHDPNSIGKLGFTGHMSWGERAGAGLAARLGKSFD